MHSAPDYDPSLPLALAHTPPAAWYGGGELAHEARTTFRRRWLAVGRTEQVREPGSYFSGRILDESYLVLRDERGALRALHNVCRHHAAPLVDGAGRCAELVCPYHGWTYGLDGALRRAPGLGAAQGFERADFALPPIAVATFGPLVLIRLDPAPAPPHGELAALARAFDPTELERLVWIGARRYELECDWKVYVENYLDGGYHVPHLHPGLAADLDLGGYSTELDAPLVVQRCAGRAGAASGERVGPGAVYAWLHPTLMLNRYGPVLDTNVVLPLGPGRCAVLFDWWLEPQAAADPARVAACLAASDAVQAEDVGICEAVQRGLRSSSYERGRLAPAFEAGMHLFHRLLAADRAGA